MKTLRTHDNGEEGDMQTDLIGINVGEGLDVTERYVGPAAWWIANRLPYPVRFEEGWFRTAALCHGGEHDGLAFRQRSDGNGIDARCLSGDCSNEVAADVVGGQAGSLVRGPTAYEPLFQPVDRFWWLTDWPRWRIAWNGGAALAFAAPLLLGHALEAAILTIIGFSAGSWLMGKLILQPRRRRYRR